MTNYKVSTQNQVISIVDVLEPPPAKPYPYDAIVMISVGIVVGIVLMGTIKACDAPQPAVKAECMGCHRKEAYTAYFKMAGSKTPEEMAYAVLSTKNPRLLAAIAKVESNGNSNIRSTGYKKRHDGAFQVNSRYWGRVGHTADEQALQAEAILTELTQAMPIKKALAHYGGDSTDRYSQKVLAELVRVP
jgi:hypothetical protein